MAARLWQLFGFDGDDPVWGIAEVVTDVGGGGPPGDLASFQG